MSDDHRAAMNAAIVEANFQAHKAMWGDRPLRPGDVIPRHLGGGQVELHVVSREEAYRHNYELIFGRRDEP